jgi:hypothetical protein
VDIGSIAVWCKLYLHRPAVAVFAVLLDEPPRLPQLFSREKRSSEIPVPKKLDVWID